jgi:hypothetical protein
MKKKEFSRGLSICINEPRDKSHLRNKVVMKKKEFSRGLSICINEPRDKSLVMHCFLRNCKENAEIFRMD